MNNQIYWFRMLAFVFIVFYAGCAGDHSSTKQIEQRISRDIRSAKKLQFEFYDLDSSPSVDPGRSLTINDPGVIRILASRFGVTSRGGAEVLQVPCGFHVEVVLGEGRGFYLLGDCDVAAYHPGLRLGRSWESQHYTIEIKPDFAECLAAYFDATVLSELMCPDADAHNK